MKMTKKVVSLALAFLMIFSVVAVSSVSVSAADNLSQYKTEDYDKNIMICYDQYIRDYSYGTGGTAAWPRQATFNKDGWVRLQSQTAEEIANGEEGLYEHQWEYRLLPTPEYIAAFKNAVVNSIENYGGVFSAYAYVKSAKLAKPNSEDSGKPDEYNESTRVDLSTRITVSVDTDYDGEYDSDYNIGSETSWTTVNPEYGFRYQNTAYVLAEVQELIENYGMDFTLKEIVLQPRNYEFEKGNKNLAGREGIGLVDIFFSPFYVDHLPGFEDYNMDNAISFDAASELDPASFTLGAINPDDWSWTAQGENADAVNDPKTVFKLGDIVRDADRYPTRKDGTIYKPVPMSKVTEEVDIVISNLKATATGNSVTLNWDYTGSPSAFDVNGSPTNDTLKVINQRVNTNTVTFTGLAANTEYRFRVRGVGNKNGKYSSYVTVKTASSAPAAPAVKSVVYSAANKVKVSWGAVSGAAKYEVQRRLGTGAYKAVKTVTTTSYTDTIKTAGSYSYRVVAISASGAKSAASAAKTIKTMSFSAKAKIKKVAAGKKQVTVTIGTKVKNAKGYEFAVGTNSKVTKGVKKTTSTKATATIKNLKAKTVYYAKVRAYTTNASGKKIYGAWSLVKKASAKTK